MARSDLLLNLVKAGFRGDQLLFKRTVEALIAEEHAKQHHVLAAQLAEFINTSSPDLGKAVIHGADERIQNLVYEVQPKRKLDELILPPPVVAACRELVEEQHRSELLRSYSLEPRHRILLVGPPGNGKTSLAEAIAEALAIPLFVVRYEGVIGSYLGETANRLKHLLDYARLRHCVLFLDEFETLGKERGDVHDTGEIKRVVSSLLLQMDSLPSHVVVISATNHPELLDRAVWRRFQLRLLLPRPSRTQIEQWFMRFQERIGFSLGYSPRALAERLTGASFAEVEGFGLDIQRRYVLSIPGGNLKEITGERLRQWRDQATGEAKSEG